MCDFTCHNQLIEFNQDINPKIYLLIIVYIYYFGLRLKTVFKMVPYSVLPGRVILIMHSTAYLVIFISRFGGCLGLFK